MYGARGGEGAPGEQHLEGVQWGGLGRSNEGHTEQQQGGAQCRGQGEQYGGGGNQALHAAGEGDIRSLRTMAPTGVAPGPLKVGQA